MLRDNDIGDEGKGTLNFEVAADEKGPVQVLLVSPSVKLRGALRDKLAHPRWSVREAESGSDALDKLIERESDVLLLDTLLPDLEPNEFHGIVHEQFPGVQVLTINSQTGQTILGASSPTRMSADLAEVLRGGALANGANSAVLIDARRMVGDGSSGLIGMVGGSAAMQRVYGATKMVARRDTSVLVTGESGTGKDLVARAIHLTSPRQKQPFVVINCAAIPEPLLEAELFGYVKGAFTGAIQSRIGRIHAAHGGTLFLDEIGDMPFPLQSKILRFLEQGEVQRLGGTDNLKVDVRVVAATNADLKKLSKQNLFREDLYYRLAVFPIHLPALRDHKEDLDDLIETFAAKFCPGTGVSAEARDLLHQHDWPGNVRELRNVLERASIFAGGEREIRSEHVSL